jgi:hypothetical protein
MGQPSLIMATPSNPEPFPLAVPTHNLAIAADLLSRPLDQVKDASEHCLPYLHCDQVTQFHSIAQMARWLGIDPARIRAKAPPKPRAKPKPRVGQRKLSDGQIRDGLAMLEGGATWAEACQVLGVGRNTLRLNIKQLGLTVDRVKLPV